MSDETQTPEATPKRTRAEIARANGAKSKGPITPEGKAISSRNGLRHGIASRHVVLPDESVDSYLALHRSYVEQFEPQTKVELDLVSIMSTAQWRMRRLLSIETHYLAHETDTRRDIIRRFVDNPDPHKSLAWTFNSVSGGTALPLLTRYESSLQRTFERALKQLQLLRAGSKPRIATRTQQSEPAS
jgi:hypothetical protein